MVSVGTVTAKKYIFSYLCAFEWMTKKHHHNFVCYFYNFCTVGESILGQYKFDLNAIYGILWASILYRALTNLFLFDALEGTARPCTKITHHSSAMAAKWVNLFLLLFNITTPNKVAACVLCCFFSSTFLSFFRVTVMLGLPLGPCWISTDIIILSQLSHIRSVALRLKARTKKVALTTSLWWDLANNESPGGGSPWRPRLLIPLWGLS